MTKITRAKTVNKREMWKKRNREKEKEVRMKNEN